MSKPNASTFTEQFATEYARNAVPNMLKAINSIKRYNRFVLLGAAADQLRHQAHYLWTQNAGYFAYLVPLIFDAAMVSMLTVVRTSGIARDAKRGALVVFACAALLSATINFASPGSLGLRLVFALVVVLVIASNSSPDASDPTSPPSKPKPPRSSPPPTPSTTGPPQTSRHLRRPPPTRPRQQTSPPRRWSVRPPRPPTTNPTTDTVTDRHVCLRRGHRDRHHGQARHHRH
ncbi:DUF2637 domain-containing protein [Salinispora arenicola]|uniref:DUF2637 domain-containing protein n=1 Tax=Salinispora arenicola TaxID=168697 RepID=UPI003F5CDFE6